MTLYPDYVRPSAEWSRCAIECFSTKLVPHRRRHLFRRDVVAEAFPGMTANASEGIQANLVRRSVGGVGLTRARSDCAKVSRVATQSDDRPTNLPREWYLRFGFDF